MKKILLAISLIFLLVACSSSKNKIQKKIFKEDIGNFKVDTSLESLAQNERIQFIVLHYTAGSN